MSTNSTCFLIHHFDNRARSTSLKVLEFNMRADNISGPAVSGGHEPPRSIRVPVLKKYNRHDVTMTKRFYHESLDMIRFRELTARYQRDFMNHNDTKIGRTTSLWNLEAAGVACYDYGPEGSQTPADPAPEHRAQDAILPWITFQHPRVPAGAGWFKQQTITGDQRVFSDIVARVHGLTLCSAWAGFTGPWSLRSLPGAIGAP